MKKKATSEQKLRKTLLVEKRVGWNNNLEWSHKKPNAFCDKGPFQNDNFVCLEEAALPVALKNLFYLFPLWKQVPKNHCKS